MLLPTCAVLVAASPQTELPPGDRTPPTVVDLVREAGTADDFKDADYVIVLDHTINHFRNLGVTYVNDHVIYKAINDKGCTQLSVLRWEFDPQSQYIEVREVNIVRGEEIIPVDVSAVKELPAPQSGIYWNNRFKVIQLPRLQVNDGIEVRTFRKGFTYALLEEGIASGAGGSEAPDDQNFIPPMPDEYFDIVLFAGGIPIIEKRYVLMLPPHKRLHSKVYNGALFSSTTYTADSTVFTWWRKDIPVWKSETRSPGESDNMPKVVMATVESWEAKSRWFFDVNDVKNQQFAYSPEIEAKVNEILTKSGVMDKNEQAKAEALIHWVAQNIRYSGQTMGKGEGFTIHSGTMIFEQRSGVCKDIAGMLITMMRAAKLDSYAAMTMAGSRIETVPADQFNHCVVALKLDDGTYQMYDPTWVPYNNDIWSKLETEQQYLIGSPQGEPLRTIPYSPPEESPLTITHKAKILENGTLEGVFLLKGKGALDSRLRRFLTGNRYPELGDYIASMLHPISDRIEKVTFEHLKGDDFSDFMWFKINYRVPDYAQMIDGGLEFKSPMMQITKNHLLLFRAGATDWTEERQNDVFLYYTQLLEGTETIQLPKNYNLPEPPKSEEIDETYASFKGSSEMNKSDLIVHQRTEVKRRQIPPDGYPGFKKSLDEMKKYADTVFRAEKGGAK